MRQKFIRRHPCFPLELFAPGKRETGPDSHRQLADSQKLSYVFPRPQLAHRVAAHYQENLPVVDARQFPYRIDRIGRPLSSYLDIRDLEERISLDRKPRHLRSMLCRRQRMIEFMRRRSRRHEKHLFQTQSLAHPFRKHKVPEMNGIETPSQDPDSRHGSLAFRPQKRPRDSSTAFRQTAGAEGLEPPTPGLENPCSIRLSYTPSILIPCPHNPTSAPCPCQFRRATHRMAFIRCRLHPGSFFFVRS